MAFDWHSDPLTRNTPLDAKFRITQNVRRFLRAELGEPVVIGVAFHAWLKTAKPQNLGDVADALQKHREVN